MFVLEVLVVDISIVEVSVVEVFVVEALIVKVSVADNSHCILFVQDKSLVYHEEKPQIGDMIVDPVHKPADQYRDVVIIWTNAARDEVCNIAMCQ